jgi:ferrochelatase
MPGAAVVFGMRYGSPSIGSALEELAEKNVTRIIVAPMYPQYSSAANGSALEVVYQWAAKRWNVPAISVLPPFFGDERFLDAWAAVAKPVLDSFRPDHILMSYHGLPERHVKKSDPTGQRCLTDSACCDDMVPENRYCYRAQCLYTSRELARRLALENDRYSNSFQSRLLRDPWLMPATDEVVPQLARKGVKRLAVICPAFTADCLETLEEIGLRAKSDFLTAGGEAFQLVPCLNSAPPWVDALAAMLERL